MLRFRSLGSGSSGNALVVEAGDGSCTSRLLVDCGLGVRQLEHRLAAAGLAFGDLDALFITHEHSDHIGCAQAVALRHRLPVWMSRGTYAGIGEPDFDGLLRTAHDLEPIAIGALSVHPFTVPHDAREPLQLRCSDGASHLGIATDFGHATAHMLERLAGCHALVLEANHDADLLAQGPYPVFLKRRVGGPHGHLGNTAAAQMLAALAHPGLAHVVAAHLSEQNNRPELVRAGLAAALDWAPEQIVVAGQRDGTAWLRAG